MQNKIFLINSKKIYFNVCYIFIYIFYKKKGPKTKICKFLLVLKMLSYEYIFRQS